jgi:hypothetical protein
MNKCGMLNGRTVLTDDKLFFDKSFHFQDDRGYCATRAPHSVLINSIGEILKCTLMFFPLLSYLATKDMKNAVVSPVTRYK